ncbi:MAG: LemA family protein [Bacteroidota bacterium]
MKASVWIVLGVLVAAALVVAVWGTGTYNTLVGLEEQVRGKWSQVESQYQRRMDLVPNLVATVQGFAEQEKSVLLGVTEARARVGQMNVTREVLEDPGSFARFQAAQDQLSSALSRLLVVSENYPELKSNENFLTLQTQLEGTENRIAVERGRFNEAVREYNTRLRRFPGSLVGSLTGFRAKEYFRSAEGSEKAPAVRF